jgi:1-acyl-sn-glycerol-3-phosphate acyltransferase
MIPKSLLRGALRQLGLGILRVQVSYSPDSVNLLRCGRVIVCANHVSLLDGVIIALASPAPLTFGVDTDFSRRSLIASMGMAVLAWMGFGAIVPIDSRSPFGLRSLCKSLEHGSSVMIFPEGRISPTGQLQPEQPGVRWLTRRTGVPVLRVQISGAERSRLFAKSGTEFWPRIEVSF